MKIFLLIIFCLTSFSNPADPRTRLRNLLNKAKIPEPLDFILNYKAVFNRVDFVIDYEIDDQIVQIEVFKSSSNDQIIQSADSQKYDKLAWLSLGYPKLVDFHRNSSIFNRFGFNLNVELLNNQIRDKICQMILQRYKIEVEHSQIADVVPRKFKCKIKLLDQNNKIHTIEGSGIDLEESTFSINFNALQNTTKRLLFEQYFYSKQDLIIQCNLEAESVETAIFGDDILSIYDVLERKYLIKVKNFQLAIPSDMSNLFQFKNITNILTVLNTVFGYINQLNERLNKIPNLTNQIIKNRTFKFLSGVFAISIEKENMLTYGILEVNSSYNLNDMHTLKRYIVEFSQSFNEPPKVLYSIKKIQLDRSLSAFHYKVSSEKISAHGMVVDLEFGIFEDIFLFDELLPRIYLNDLEIRWFAIGY